MLDWEVLLMLYTVEEIRGKLTPIFEEKGVIRAILFGSYAKGEATPESDIDIAAFVDEDMPIVSFCAIADVVINKLGKEVDFFIWRRYYPRRKNRLGVKKGWCSSV